MSASASVVCRHRGVNSSDAWLPGDYLRRCIHFKRNITRPYSCTRTLRRRPTPAECADELHAGTQFARVEIECCELGLQRDCLRRDYVEIARGALPVLSQ